MRCRWFHSHDSRLVGCLFDYSKYCTKCSCNHYRHANLFLLKRVMWWLSMRELAIIMREIGSLRRIYGKYTVIHENIRTLRLILCVRIAILGGNKTQMRESWQVCHYGNNSDHVFWLAALLCGPGLATISPASSVGLGIIIIMLKKL